MIGRTFRYLLGVAGYLLWTTGAAILFLWLFFPDQAVRQWLEGQAAAHVGGAGVPVIRSLRLVSPIRLEVRGISLKTRDKSQDLVQVEQLVVQADPARWLGGEWVLTWTADLGGGRAGGLIRLPEKGRIRVEGRTEGVRIEQAVRLDLLTGRRVTGELRAEGNCLIATAFGNKPRCEATFTVLQGEIPLRRALLGMNKVTYGRIQGRMEILGPVIRVGQGRADSRLFTAAFQGEARLRLPLSETGLRAEGSFKPRPELLRKNDRPLEAAAIRELAAQEGLPFLLNGTLAEPGLKLAGRSLASWERIGRQW